MNKEEFTKDLEHWTREEIINRAYDICCESIELQQRIDKAIEYAEKSSVTLKSQYFIDMVNILKGNND